MARTSVNQLFSERTNSYARSRRNNNNKGELWLVFWPVWRARWSGTIHRRFQKRKLRQVWYQWSASQIHTVLRSAALRKGLQYSITKNDLKMRQLPVYSSIYIFLLNFADYSYSFLLFYADFSELAFQSSIVARRLRHEGWLWRRTQSRWRLVWCRRSC